MNARIVFLLVVVSLMAATMARADYDPRDDPNSPQGRAAARAAREAREAAHIAKVKRDAEQAAAEKKTADPYRALYPEKAKGLTDKEVIAAVPRWVKQAEQDGRAQAASMLSSMSPAHLAMMEQKMGKEKFEQWKQAMSGQTAKPDTKK